LSDGREIWLSTAHAQFARHGESTLKIDSLAQLVGKSRSSFYHLFGDMEEFFDALIVYDLQITKQFQKETKDLDAFFPDFANIMVKYKDMLFFNKQLFLGSKTNEKFNDAWEEVTKYTDNKTEELWMKLFNLQDLSPHEKEQFYLTIRTAAFIRLQYDSYTYDKIYEVVNDVNNSFKFLMKKNIGPVQSSD
jgi:AcrR family transcriptional regulator